MSAPTDTEWIEACIRAARERLHKKSVARSDAQHAIESGRAGSVLEYNEADDAHLIAWHTLRILKHALAERPRKLKRGA